MKFRIWSKKYKMFTNDPRWPNNQRTHEKFVLTPAGEVWCLVTTDNENYFRDLSSEDEYVIQRATGLKDVNDKEIYEGDIIEFEGGQYDDGPYKLKVLCDSQYFWSAEGEGRDETNFVDFVSNVNAESKIVGNILENPELA